MKNIILLFFLMLFLHSCNTLELKHDMYCEIAFAYPIDQDLPTNLEKELIGCACTTKDILQGKEIKSWELHPLEDCRRVRGFHPLIWKKEIDPWFQYQYKKYGSILKSK
jgi:hypothetical protein